MIKTELNYADLFAEIENQLREAQVIFLATCAGNRVTARAMAHINDGITILFSTGGNSLKVSQMRDNANVALAVGNIQIEGVADILGHPSETPSFQKEYAVKFPRYMELYQSNPDEILVIVRPTRIALYKYIDGACEEVLLPNENRAYRVAL